MDTTRTHVDTVSPFRLGVKVAELTLEAEPLNQPLQTLSERLSELITFARVLEGEENRGQLSVYTEALARVESARTKELTLSAQIAQCEGKVASLTAHLAMLRASLPRVRATLRLVKK
jgi:prefoldin subunit 5